MKDVEQAMEEAFNELMNMSDEQLQSRFEEFVENPGIFGRMAQDGFVPSLTNKIDIDE